MATSYNKSKGLTHGPLRYFAALPHSLAAQLVLPRNGRSQQGSTHRPAPGSSRAGLPSRLAQHLRQGLDFPWASTPIGAKFPHQSENKVERNKSWGLSVKEEKKKIFQGNFFKGPFIFILRRHLNLSDTVNHFFLNMTMLLYPYLFPHGLMEMKGKYFPHPKIHTKNILARASNFSVLFSVHVCLI